jgi:hypothetical protein
MALGDSLTTTRENIPDPVKFLLGVSIYRFLLLLNLSKVGFIIPGFTPIAGK